MLNKKLIRKILSDCAFSPVEPGPMKIIADVGDPVYYQTRVRELLESIRGGARLHSNIPTLQMCIQLLTLSIGELQHEQVQCKVSRSRFDLDTALTRDSDQ